MRSLHYNIGKVESIDDLLVEKAQALIRSSGREDRTHARWRAGAFEVVDASDGDSYSLRIAHLGCEVLTLLCVGPRDLGNLTMHPGCWQADFLSLRAER